MKAIAAIALLLLCGCTATLIGPDCRMLAVVAGNASAHCERPMPSTTPNDLPPTPGRPAWAITPATALSTPTPQADAIIVDARGGTISPTFADVAGTAITALFAWLMH